jgi:hypothetical protein
MQAVRSMCSASGSIAEINECLGWICEEFYEQIINVSSTVAAQGKAWIVVARSNAGIVGSNPTQGMDASVCI